jgi:enterochelin esterase-like enzyme
MPHLSEIYRLSADPRQTLNTGISMGGMGSLRLALK